MPRPRRSLERRLRLLAGGVALLLAGIVALLVFVVRDFESDSDRREELLPAATNASDLSRILVDQLDALDGEDPAGPAAVEEYTEARIRTTVLLGRLEVQLRDEPELLTALAPLRDELLGWQAQVSLVAAQGGRQVGSVTAPDIPGLRARLTGLVGLVDDVTVQITEEVATASDAASSSRAVFLWSVAAVVALALVLLVVGAVELRHWVVVPVRRLSNEVARVAGGAYERDLDDFGDVESTEEVARLASSVGRMRDRILTERDQAARAVEAVDQQAPAVVALRALLAPRLDAAPAGIDVAGAQLPAQGELAGDWFDIVRRDDLVVIGLGDVCGHGVDAGVLAVRTKFALLDAIDLGLDPARALDLASRRFRSQDTFATTILVEIDAARGTCRYASAGHNPGLLISSGGEVTMLTRTGPLIGLADGPRPAVTMPVRTGDLVVFYTDGVVEARDARGALIDVEGLLDVLLAHAAEPVGRLTEIVMGKVLSHCGGRCADDATIAIARVTA